MKRLLLSGILTCALSPLAWAASEFYINDGIVSVVNPPTPPPQIDATNFVNNGTFFVTNFNTATPFETQNTLNYSNRYRMAGYTGFRFYTFDGALRRSAANFVNANQVNETNATVFGADYLQVSATNIVNRGTLSVGSYGLLSLTGKDLDLERGGVNVVNDTTSFAGVSDRYWGVDTNDFFSGYFDQNNPASAWHLVTSVQYQTYVQFYQMLTLAGGFSAHVVITPTGPTNRNVDVLFLGNPNPAISTEVRFFGGGAIKSVQWRAVVTNCFTGQPITNLLYLIDDFATRETNYVVQTYRGSPYLTPTYHPANYTIVGSWPFFTIGALIQPTVFDPTLFYGTVSPVWATNTGYGASLNDLWAMVDLNITGATFSNLPGRVEISADRALNLSRTRIDGQNYLSLKCTNHFLGNTNSQIFSRVTDMNLVTTNGTLGAAGLLAPTVPCFGGEIDVWSGRWTNTSAAGIGSRYNVTMVGSRLVTEVRTLIPHLLLRSTNVFIGDIMNVFSNLLIEAEGLTITTNSPGAPTLTGEINLSSPNILWTPSLPRLQYLTNWGKITALNPAYFAGARRPPFYSGSFDEPYQAFVNHGLISTEGNSTWANYYESDGTNASGSGPITVQSATASLANGAFLATNADITLTSGSLLASNQLLLAGRRLTLAVTNWISDCATNWATPTNNNVWLVGDGLDLLIKPPEGDLLGTTVTNVAFAYANAINQWAGEDRGCSVAGYTNNVAVGRLILDGGYDSLFTFRGVGGNNALYVDWIELKNYATNRNALGDFVMLQIDPGMKIYFAQAMANGVSIAEKLDGRNGGRLCWVSNYAGLFSSTNLVYPDGSTNTLNAALVQSCNLDSDGDGIVNCADPTPVFFPLNLRVTVTLTNQPPLTALVSWPTVGNSTNYLFYKSDLTNTNWQLLTNFIQGPVDRPVTVRHQAQPAGCFYKVRVDTARP